MQTTRLSDQIDATIVPERLISALSELFGGLGSLLAAVGLYRLLTYTVARRTTEIGVRVALGATSAHIIRILFRDALQMVGLGLLLGVPLARWAAAAAANLIPNLPPNNAAPIAFGAVGMLAIAMLAAYLTGPARGGRRSDDRIAARVTSVCDSIYCGIENGKAGPALFARRRNGQPPG